MGWLKRYAALLVAVVALAVALSNGGSQGPQGESGSRGAKGSQGATGDQGERGPDGDDLSGDLDDLGEEVSDLWDTARYLCASLSDGARARAEQDLAAKVLEAKLERAALLAEFNRKKANGELDPDSLEAQVGPFIPVLVPTRGLCK